MTGIRGNILNTRLNEERTPENKVYISSMSGGLSFAIVGLVTRVNYRTFCSKYALTHFLGGRTNVIPGTIMGSLVMYLGQKGYNMLDNRHTAAITAPPEPREAFWRRALNSKWSPMKVLSDTQYAALLKEKLLRVDTDIAVIDDDIAKWKQRQEAPPIQEPVGSDRAQQTNQK